MGTCCSWIVIWQDTVGTSDPDIAGACDEAESISQGRFNGTCTAVFTSVFRGLSAQVISSCSCQQRTHVAFEFRHISKQKLIFSLHWFHVFWYTLTRLASICDLCQQTCSTHMFNATESGYVKSRPQNHFINAAPHFALVAQFTNSQLMLFVAAFKDSIASVHQDGGVTATDIQYNVSWALDRIDQDNLPLNNEYIYSSTGSNVNIYIVDTVRPFPARHTCLCMLSAVHWARGLQKQLSSQIILLLKQQSKECIAVLQAFSKMRLTQQSCSARVPSALLLLYTAQSATYRCILFMLSDVLDTSVRCHTGHQDKP